MERPNKMICSIMNEDEKNECILKLFCAVVIGILFLLPFRNGVK